MVFNCRFWNTTGAFVFVNDFLVCQDNVVYKPGPATTNNPMPVPKGGLNATVRVQVYNSLLTTCAPASALGCFNDLNHGCGFTMVLRDAARMTQEMCAGLCGRTGAYAVSGVETGTECWCGQQSDLTHCPQAAASECSQPCAGNASETCGASWRLQPYAIVCAPGAPAAHVGLEVLYQVYNSTPPVPYPTSWLSTAVSEGESERRALQQRLLTGWNTWLSHNILSIAHLPEGLYINIELCNKGDPVCLIQTAIEGGAAVRVGPHAIDNSYVQFYVSGAPQHVRANISIEWSATPDLALTITPVTCDGGCDNYYIRIRPEFAWLRRGTSTISLSSILFSPHGLSETILYTTAAGQIESGALSISLGGGAIGISSNTQQSLAAIQSSIQAALTTEMKVYEQYGELADVKMAVQASVAWNLVYVPVEYGPILPVSRSWNFAPSPIGDEWRYVIFDWDNFFASYIAGIDRLTTDAARLVSYSNLIQTVKSRTVAGFVPNFYSGGAASQDRSEPPVGAFITLQLYKRWQDTWLLSYLFDDLAAWNDWYATHRQCGQGVDLVCLGSFNEQYQYYGQGDQGNSMQDARFESGLDNSPMYDGNFFNTTSHRMQLWDVGMSAMLINEADALAAIAAILGRADDVHKYQQRAAALRQQLGAFWDEQTGMYVNRFTNQSFYRRISPTSFYAMLATAATDAQAEAMVSTYLFSPKHFCIAPQGDFAGNTNECYWGLPSIEASDPAFPPLGYWRGYVWGPMAQLTFWSLQNYAHVPVVKQGATALAKQMSALMMNQWNRNRHICENFNPHKNATDCSGTLFYHWGALAGLIELLDQGY